MTKPISLLRRELHAFCELAIRRGWRIANDSYGSAANRTCCPLGAVAIGVHGRLSASPGNSLIGGQDNANEFTAAFDGSWSQSGPYADLGREFRKHYCPEES